MIGYCLLVIALPTVAFFDNRSFSEGCGGGGVIWLKRSAISSQASIPASRDFVSSFLNFLLLPGVFPITAFIFRNHFFYETE